MACLGAAKSTTPRLPARTRPPVRRSGRCERLLAAARPPGFDVARHALDGPRRVDVGRLEEAVVAGVLGQRQLAAEEIGGPALLALEPYNDRSHLLQAAHELLDARR